MNTNNLSRREMRIEIAKDAVAQIRSGKMKVSTGNYFSFNTHEVNPESQVCEVLKTKTCEVCALGSMFASSVNKYNDLVVNQLWIYSANDTVNLSRDTTVRRLSKYFDIHQLNLIEYFFERRNVLDELWPAISVALHRQHAPIDIQKLINHYFSDSYATNSLIKILQNIIANDGDFVIPRSVFRKCGMSDSDYRYWRFHLASKD
jgi:hypothetical protein